MLEEQNNVPKRKFAWVDKRARIDAKVNNTYIVYEKNGKLLKEYPNGDIVPLYKDGE